MSGGANARARVARASNQMENRVTVDHGLAAVVELAEEDLTCALTFSPDGQLAPISTFRSGGGHGGCGESGVDASTRPVDTPRGRPDRGGTPAHRSRLSPSDNDDVRPTNANHVSRRAAQWRDRDLSRSADGASQNKIVAAPAALSATPQPFPRVADVSFDQRAQTPAPAQAGFCDLSRHQLQTRS